MCTLGKDGKDRRPYSSKILLTYKLSMVFIDKAYEICMVYTINNDTAAITSKVYLSISEKSKTTITTKNQTTLKEE